MNRKKLGFCLVGLLVSTWSSVSVSQTMMKSYHLKMGPIVGGGDVSTEESVRHVSGYSLNFGRFYSLIKDRFALGPVAGFTNSYVSTRGEDNGKTTVSTYDNRMFSAGLAGLWAPFAGRVRFYSGLSFGQAFSKLQRDKSESNNDFEQSLIRGVRGPFSELDLGTIFAFDEEFAFNFGVKLMEYRADHSQASGTRQADVGNENGLTLSGPIDPAAERLPSIQVQRSVTASLAVQVFL